MALILALESSCDDSAAALVTSDRQILAQAVVGQNEAHRPFGGVVPEIAARAQAGPSADDGEWQDKLFSALENGFGFWLVERLDDGLLVGLCGLFRRAALEGPDLGYALLAEHEGQGYAREAAAGCILHAREVLGWTELLAITSPENPRSHALLRKLGFVDGELRQLEGYTEPSRIWRLALN